MGKRLIIVLVGYKVKEFDFLRFDAREFEDKEGIKVHFHELVDYLNPGFSKMFSKTYISEQIKKFNEFNEWKKEIINNKKEFGEKILIINEIQNHSFKSLKINYLLKKIKIKSIYFSNFDHPSNSSLQTSYKISWLIKNIFFNQKKLKIFLESKISSILENLLGLKKEFFFKSGQNSNKEEKKLCTKVIHGHSRDYNMHLKMKNIKFERNDNYGLFLESATPVHNKGDSFITGDDANFRGTPNNWLNSIKNFFDTIEKKLKIKILIVPHPKIKHPDRNSKLYGGREILSSPLSLAAKNARLIISRDSQGSSFAAIYKLPGIFIYNNELKFLKNNFLLNQKKFANSFGLEPINIDEKLDYNKLKKALYFENRNYENYIKEYLTSRNDNKFNYQIISETFNF